MPPTIKGTWRHSSWIGLSAFFAQAHLWYEKAESSMTTLSLGNHSFILEVPSLDEAHGMDAEYGMERNLLNTRCEEANLLSLIYNFEEVAPARFMGLTKRYLHCRDKHGRRGGLHQKIKEKIIKFGDKKRYYARKRALKREDELEEIEKTKK